MHSFQVYIEVFLYIAEFIFFAAAIMNYNIYVMVLWVINLINVQYVFVHQQNIKFLPYLPNSSKNAQLTEQLVDVGAIFWSSNISAKFAGLISNW